MKVAITTHQLGSSATLGYCHFLQRTLHFLKVQTLASNLNLGFEDRLDLFELIGIAGDEVDVVSHCFENPPSD